MIADLHCHFPMHLVHDELDPHGHLMNWWESVKGELEQDAFDLAARLLDHPWSKGWRVDLDGLKEGGVGVVCSVLYWPAAEFLPGPYPRPQSFPELMTQLEDVEKHLRSSDQVIVTCAKHLDDKRTRFVHCVEGGFHLGSDLSAIDGNVRLLAERGVFYITLAHLLFRGIATNAAALPGVSDELFDFLCQQTSDGLTDLGERAVKAMVAHKVVVDVSHMNQNALDATFALLDKEDDKRQLPVIASHVGARSESPHQQHYSLTPDTMRKIQERDGLIGLIFSQHQIGKTHKVEDSRSAVLRHLWAIHDAVGGHEHTALGSDLDGFVHPLFGIDRPSKMTTLADWIHEEFGDDAEAILHGNAERVLKRTYELRDTAGRS